MLIRWSRCFEICHTSRRITSQRPIMRGGLSVNESYVRSYDAMQRAIEKKASGSCQLELLNSV